MKQNAYAKEIRRSISRSLSRFLAIASIVALGAGFLAGLTASAPDMRITADEYYDETHMMDFRILSTLGLTDDDVRALSEIEGIQDVMPAYYTDQPAYIGDEQYLVRVQSMPDTVNELVLLEGRMPREGASECVINPGKMGGEMLSIGDTVSMPDAGDDLECTEYTIVGFVRSSLYLSFSFGSTSMGNGNLNYVMYIPSEDFQAECYTEVYMTVEDAREFNAFSKEYTELIETVKERIQGITEEREKARYEEIVGEARKQLQEGYDEYDTAEAEAEAQLEDARRTLEEAEEELARSEEKLAEGQIQYEEGVASYETGQKEAERQLASGESALDAAQKEADSGGIALQRTYAQLEDARRVLENSRVEFDDAGQLLKAQQKQLEEGAVQLQEAQEQLVASKEQLDRSDEQLSAMKAKLDASKEELEVSREQLEQAQMTLDALQETVNRMESRVQEMNGQMQQLAQRIQELKEEGRDEEAQAYESDLAALETARDGLTGELDTYRQQYTEGLAAYTENYAAYENGLGAYQSGQAAYEGAYGELASGWDRYESGLAEYEGQLAAYEEGRQALEAAQAQYDAGEQAYREGNSRYQSGLAAYEEGYAQWQKGLEEIAAGRATLRQTRMQTEAAMEEAWQQLEDSRKSLEEGQEQLEQARLELSKGNDEYEEARQKAETELQNAREELTDAEQQIQEIEYPEWYVLTRNENEGFVSYKNDADRMASIATVFPWLFFFVAALVSLTSMTRMVEEERVLIGTYKALGLSKGAIAMKYVLYALAASLLGSAVGIILLMKLLPYVICEAYGTMYVIESDTLTPFYLSYTLVSALAAVACTVGATILACYRSLTEVPAALMMPAAPKAGKRILLERVGWLWRRMQFSHKVTARNLFRYKKRLIMTIVGISGCTALLLTGFGIRDSVSGILTMQYNEIYQYDITLGLEDTAELTAIESGLAEIDGVKAYQPVELKNTEVRSAAGGQRSYDISLYVPERMDTLDQFVALRTRTKHTKVAWNPDTVILTEKLAGKLEVSVGDTIQIRNASDRYIEVTVGGITEHYIRDYVYISRELYEKLLGDTWMPNEIVVLQDESVDESELTAAIRKDVPGITTIQNTNDATSSFQDMLDSLNSVIVVIIVAAGLLAFIVLYNLTNINITERKREIATIKVLGFYDGEVNAYVYRETAALTVLGCLCGLVLGIFMHRFVIQTVEVDMVMFSRTIHAMSFVYAALLTLVFSVIVNVVMNKKLKQISMVESLKSVD